MQITARTDSGCTVLGLSGQLVAGMDLAELRNAVHDATGKHPKKLILNLANVTYVDSCGVGELVNTFNYVKNQGGRLVLSNLPRRVRTLLDIAQLMKIFEVSDSEQAASVSPGQQGSQQQLCY